MRRRGYYDLTDPTPTEHTGSVEESLQRSEEIANRVVDALLDQISNWKATIPEDCSSRELERMVRKAALIPPVSLSNVDSDILKCYIAWKFMRADRRVESETRAIAATKEEATSQFGQEAVDALDPDWLRQFARDTLNRITGEGPSSYVRGSLFPEGSARFYSGWAAHHAPRRWRQSGAASYSQWNASSRRGF